MERIVILGQPHRWRTGENPLLDTMHYGATDWIGVFWELSRIRNGEEGWIQFLLGPDVLATRKGSLDTAQPVELARFTYPGRHVTMTNQASEFTGDLIRRNGWKIAAKPSVIDFTDEGGHLSMMTLHEDFFQQHCVSTLGDALAHSVDSILEGIFQQAEQLYKV